MWQFPNKDYDQRDVWQVATELVYEFIGEGHMAERIRFPYWFPEELAMAFCVCNGLEQVKPTTYYMSVDFPTMKSTRI